MTKPEDVDECSRACGCYAVGDRVVATKDIWEDANDHSPASMYAAKGDVLIVRKRDMIFPVNVSHEDRSDASFGVELDEIRSA